MSHEKFLNYVLYLAQIRLPGYLFCCALLKERMSCAAIVNEILCQACSNKVLMGVVLFLSLFYVIWYMQKENR